MNALPVIMSAYNPNYSVRVVELSAQANRLLLTRQGEFNKLLIIHLDHFGREILDAAMSTIVDTCNIQQESASRLRPPVMQMKTQKTTLTQTCMHTGT